MLHSLSVLSNNDASRVLLKQNIDLPLPTHTLRLGTLSAARWLIIRSQYSGTFSSLKYTKCFEIFKTFHPTKKLRYPNYDLQLLLLKPF
jgi:hypothetical protein